MLGSMSQGLSPELRGLLSPGAYPHPVTTVELIETHISWVLLAGEFAYKMARPVRYAFIDLTDPRRRAALCEEGLRLNRRFAPALYLDVCDVVLRDGAAHIGGGGTVIARALRMRRFPSRDLLDHLLDVDAIDPAALERFGRELADVHARLPVAGPDAAAARPARVIEALRENFRQACAVLPASGGRLAAIGRGLDARIGAAASAIAMRCANGCIRECHGDLHAGNVVRLGSTLQAFDCLEFDEALRWIDVADELAFLHVDLSARQRPLHANAFLNGYLARGGDYAACRVLDLYRAHRALIRAKVAVLSQTAASRIENWLHAAEAALAPRRPQLILMSGLSGSGKTWLAHALVPLMDAVHLRSDVERRRLAGLPEAASSRSMPGAGLYTPDHNAAVYGRLEQCVTDVLAGGRSIIVDAAFLSRGDRARFADLATRFRLRVQVLRVGAPENVLRQRLAARAAAGSDASEADAAVLAWQMAHAEPLRPEEGFDCIDVDSTGLSTPTIQALARRLAD
jgi:aminoglycoside phosphotransferase family enzyme/predicted kinase